jgi:hypothetical protein
LRFNERHKRKKAGKSPRREEEKRVSEERKIRIGQKEIQD